MIIEAYMQRMQPHYCSYDQFRCVLSRFSFEQACLFRRILAATFNVNNKVPPTTESVYAWLGELEQHNFIPQLFAIG